MNIFEITIQRKYEDSWRVVTEYTKMGELPIRREGTLKLNSKDNFAEIGALLPRKYGEMMSKALFYDDVRDAFVEALAQLEGSQDDNDCLHVLLQIEAEDLRELRWERLCAPKNWNFLILNQRTPLSFYIPTCVERRFPPIGQRDLRALVVVANPQGLKEFQLADFDDSKTVASVKQALGEIPCDVLANVDGAVGLPTPDELMKHLTQQDKYYTLLHIVCHGKLLPDGETAIYLAGANKCVEPLNGSTLIEGLNNLKHAPHFAFLSTCESASAEAEMSMGGLAQRLVRELGMPAVVAMTEKVSIETAQALATTFYQQLRSHGNVDLALVEATAGLQGRGDITVPALFSRLGGRPLFSNVVREQLTNEEIKYGLEKLKQLLPERAPVLSEKLQKHIKTIHGVLGGESATALKECKEALDEVNCISSEVLDLSFKALALGKEPNPYDPHCPFRGLYPFRYEDREFFCGRKDLIEQLQQKLSEHNFLPILGASGSGKSSVVMAGLIPALKQKEPQLVMAYMTPKVDPLAQLEASLADVQNKPYILVVDQFEEIFTLCNDKDKRQNFIDELLKLAQNQRVILTMRADFWGECAIHPKLRDLMEKQQKLIAPMNAAELRNAIDEQTRKVGLRFEADLLNKILDHLEGEPGAMPLLQHALLELWNRRHGRWILSEEYRNIGGVKQTIATTADDFYGKLTQQEKDLVRNIFVRLTRLDENAVKIENSRDTRKRVEFETLIFDDSDTDITRNLVERLAGAGKRLVITSVNEVTQKPEVEVAHEALIRYWSKLRGWLIEDRGGLLLRQRTEKEAEEWESTGKKEDLLLLQGSRLQEAVGLLLGKGRVRLNKLEKGRDYVVACQKLQERKRSELEKQRDEALENQITTLTALAEARFQDDQLGALVHILKAGRILQQLRDSKSPWMQQDDHFQAEVILVQILGKIQESNRLEGHQGDIRSIDFSTNGEIATVDGTGTVMFWQQNGEKLETSLPPNLRSSSVVFRPNSREIAAAIEDRIYLWDLDNEEPIKILSKNTGYIQAIAFSSDGKMLATASMEGDYDNYKETNTLHLWNLDDGRSGTPSGLDTDERGNGVHFQMAVAVSPDGGMVASAGWGGIRFWANDTIISLEGGLKGAVTAVSFSLDGQMIVASSVGEDNKSGEDETLKLWKIDGPLRANFKGHRDGVWGVDISPDNETIASGGQDTTIRLWNTSGSLLKTLYGHKAVVRAVRFSQSGQILASASDDRTVKLWKLGGTPIKILSDHTDIVYTVRFSPDGTIFTTSGHGYVNEWKLDGTLLETKKIHGGAISTLEFSSNGMMVTTSGDRGVKLWNSDGSLLTDLRDERGAVAHQGESLSTSFSPNNQIIATGGVSRIIKLWSTDRSFMKNLGEHEDTIWGVSFSPEGETIASASQDGTVKLWSIDGSSVQTLSRQDFVFYDVTFSPDDELDNQIIAAAAADGTVRRWKRDGTELSPLEGHKNVVRAVCFSPNGQLIATASYDKTVKLWNRDGTLQKTLYGHTDHVNAVAFSKDGKTLASASNDKTAILWNVEQKLGLDRLIDYGCDWISGYLRNNPKVSESDKKVLSEENFPLLKYESKCNQTS